MRLCSPVAWSWRDDSLLIYKNSHQELRGTISGHLVSMSKVRRGEVASDQEEDHGHQHHLTRSHCQELQARLRLFKLIMHCWRPGSLSQGELH